MILQIQNKKFFNKLYSCISFEAANIPQIQFPLAFTKEKKSFESFCHMMDTSDFPEQALLFFPEEHS